MTVYKSVTVSLPYYLKPAVLTHDNDF